MFEKTQERLSCDLCDEELNKKNTSSLFHCKQCNEFKTKLNELRKKLGYKF